MKIIYRCLTLMLGTLLIFGCGQQRLAGNELGGKGISNNKITFILVHGAWHGAWTFEQVIPLLEADGHRAIAIDLPGHGRDLSSVSKITMDDYVERLVSYIDSTDGEVVIIAHSLGGGAATGAAEVRPKKIRALVFVAAFMPQDGETLLELATADKDAQVYENLVFDKDGNFSFFNRDGAQEVFYNDVTDEAVIGDSIMRLNAQPLAPYSFKFVLTDDAYGSVRKFYINTLADKAITPEFQQMMIERVPSINVRTMDTGHSPFLSKPEAFTSIILSLDYQPD